VNQANILNRALKLKDATVAASAVKENAPLLTQDKKLVTFLQQIGVQVEKLTLPNQK